MLRRVHVVSFRTALVMGCLLIALLGAEAPAVAQADRVTSPDNGATLQTPDGFVGPLVTERQSLARRILDHGRINLIDFHVSGNYHPRSTALQNVQTTANGNAAWRSPWGHYGETRVWLKARMLRGMLKLRTEYGHSFRVTSIAGGRHSSTSRHYAGLAFDVDRVNGGPVNASNPRWGFRNHCRELGATEVLGPGNAGHDTHLHCAWPR